MDASFQEKSRWLLFVSLIAVFGIYFAAALPFARTEIGRAHV